MRYVHDNEDEYGFTVKSGLPPETVETTVGGVVITMVIDSGASTNITDRNLWTNLKQKRIKCVSTRKSDKNLYAYGSKEPLKILGTFAASTKIGEKEVQAEFVVIDGDGDALLGKETAVQLGVLKLEVPIYSVKSKETLVSDYKEVFEGVGKLEGYQVKLQ